MLKTISNVDEVLQFSWELNNDYKNATFPRNKNLKEAKENIERYINKDNYQALAYYKDDKLCGLFLYFSLAKNKYVQTKTILIKDDHYNAMDKFIKYIKEKYKGYEFFLTGIPFTNKILSQYFIDKNIECIESSIVTRLDNLKPRSKDSSNLNEITLENFDSYSSFHDRHALPLEMFYDSKNLKNDIDRFKIYTYKDKASIRGSIFAKVVKRDAEIFAIFIDDEYKNQNIGQILIDKLLSGIYNEYGLIDELIYFVDQDDDYYLKLVLDKGFQVISNFKTYKIIL